MYTWHNIADTLTLLSSLLSFLYILATTCSVLLCSTDLDLSWSIVTFTSSTVSSISNHTPHRTQSVCIIKTNDIHLYRF